MIADTEDNAVDFATYQILIRWADGKSITEIAAEFNLTEGQVRSRMSKVPKDVIEAKKIRDEARSTKFRRIESMSDDIILDYLEKTKNAIAEPTAVLNPKQLRAVIAISSNFADKANLSEGKATDRIKVDKEPTEEEWLAYWDKQKEAGNGIDLQSIQT